MPKKSAATSAPEASNLSAAAPAVKTYSMDEIKKHNTRKDCWIVVCANFACIRFVDAFAPSLGAPDLPGHTLRELRPPLLSGPFSLRVLLRRILCADNFGRFL